MRTAWSHRRRKYKICHISDVAEVVSSNVPVADDGKGLIDHCSATRRRWGRQEHIYTRLRAFVQLHSMCPVTLCINTM